MGEANGAGAVVAALTLAVGLVIAVIASVEDLRTHLLRDVRTGALAAVAVAGFTLAAPLGGGWRPLPMVLGAVAFATPWLVVHLIAPAAAGFGDVKFSAALGLHLGWLDPVLSMWAVVAGCGVFVTWAVAARAARHEPRPFGPALVAGSVIAVGVAALG
ncbi:MAG: prepilin peptidase [Acidimicrobiales bacterium]